MWAGVMVAQLGADEFLVAGIDCRVQFAAPVHPAESRCSCCEWKRAGMTGLRGFLRGFGMGMRRIMG